MKTKGKYKLFQDPSYKKEDEKFSYGNYRKWFLSRRTCRYVKHKLSRMENYLVGAR